MTILSLPLPLEFLYWPGVFILKQPEEEFQAIGSVLMVMKTDNIYMCNQHIISSSLDSDNYSCNELRQLCSGTPKPKISA